MTPRLKSGTEPVAVWPSKSDFLEKIEDEKYHGIPEEYFHVNRSGRIALDSEVACQLKWHIDGDYPKGYNIACSGGEVKLDGEAIKINPGFWCSVVPEDKLVEEN